MDQKFCFPKWSIFFLVGISFLCQACNSPNEDIEEPPRDISQLPIKLPGSLQNPAWSPDGRELLFTQFEHGYNLEPANLFIYNPEKGTVRLLVSDGNGNINLPGSAWNSVTQQIVFSSSREPHDEIYLIDFDGKPGDERRLTSREGFAAYEPSFSPDGQWVVFESHRVEEVDNGVIMKYKTDGSGDYISLTSPAYDCRQPNWSTRGDWIVYQRFSNGQWDLWVVDVNGANGQQITSGSGDKTDASFSPDGNWIVYSSDENELEWASIFIISVLGGNSLRVTDYSGYAGAPAWSPNGVKIAFEASSGSPEGSQGTTLWMVNTPTH